MTPFMIPYGFFLKFKFIFSFRLMIAPLINFTLKLAELICPGGGKTHLLNMITGQGGKVGEVAMKINPSECVTWDADLLFRCIWMNKTDWAKPLCEKPEFNVIGDDGELLPHNIHILADALNAARQLSAHSGKVLHSLDYSKMMERLDAFVKVLATFRGASEQDFQSLSNAIDNGSLPVGGFFLNASDLCFLCTHLALAEFDSALWEPELLAIYHDCISDSDDVDLRKMLKLICDAKGGRLKRVAGDKLLYLQSMFIPETTLAHKFLNQFHHGLPDANILPITRTGISAILAAVLKCCPSVSSMPEIGRIRKYLDEIKNIRKYQDIMYCVAINNASDFIQKQPAHIIITRLQNFVDRVAPTRQYTDEGAAFSLEQLVSLVETPGKRIVLHGPSGVGKTTLALELQFRSRSSYDLCTIVSGDSVEHFKKDIKSIAINILYPACECTVDDDELLCELKVYLDNPEFKWLMLVDDIMFPADVLETYLPNNGCIIMTSSKVLGKNYKFTQLQINPFSTTDSLNLIKARLNRLLNVDIFAESYALLLRKLTECLESDFVMNLPLVVDSLAGLLSTPDLIRIAKDTSDVEKLKKLEDKFVSILDLYHTNIKDLPNSTSNHPGATGSLILWKQRLTDMHPALLAEALIELWRCCSLLSTKIPLDLFDEILNGLCAKFSINKNQLEELQGFGNIIQKNDTYMYMHRIWQDCSRLYFSVNPPSGGKPTDFMSEVESCTCLIVMNALSVNLNGKFKYFTQKERCFLWIQSARRFLDLHWFGKELERANYPGGLLYKSINCRLTMAEVSEDYGMAHEMLLTLEKEYKELKMPFPILQKIVICRELAKTYSDKDNHIEAGNHYQEAVQLCEQLVGTDRLTETLICTAKLGDFFRSTGMYKEAEDYLWFTMHEREILFGMNNRDRALEKSLYSSYNQYGSFLRDTGFYFDSELYLRKAFIGRERLKGSLDPFGTLASQQRLGVVLCQLGRLDEAEYHISSALHGRSQTQLRGTRDVTISSISWLYNILLERLKTETYGSWADIDALRTKAHELSDQALSTREEFMMKYGKGKHDYLLSKFDRARLAAFEGKFIEAEQTLTDTYTMLSTTFGDSHPDCLSVAHELGLVFFKSAKLQEAATWISAVLQHRRNKFDYINAHHPLTMETVYDLASVYQAQGLMSRETLMQHFQGAYEGLKISLGDMHPLTKKTMQKLSELGVDLSLVSNNLRYIYCCHHPNVVIILFQSN